MADGWHTVKAAMGAVRAFVEGDAGNRLVVAVRRRPFNQKEQTEGEADASFMECHGNTVVVKAHDIAEEMDRIFEDKEFGYDNVFDEISTQEEVYQAMGEPLLENAMNAYNGCVFAYGQTSSGKTHSIVGDLASDSGRGIQPRACMRLFELLDARRTENPSFQFTCLASYMEIYNEKIFDLLSSACQDSKDQLHVRLHPALGPIVANLTESPIFSYSDAFELFDYGAKRRAVGATQMNETSSRSHAIFTVQIRTQQRISGGTTESQAKIHFVDLAGSERQKKTQATGERFREGIGINQSLSTLSRVIHDLSAKGSKALPPFRESKLTLLLKDALMDNSRTALLACISPAKSNLAETISTLQFAERCKLVKTRARKNEESRADVIQKLTVEKEAIQSQLQLEKSKSEDLCRQLQEEIEKVEQAERNTEDAISAKRETEEKLRELEVEHASLSQALREQALEDKTKLEARNGRRDSEVLREKLAEKFVALEEHKQREISKLEERERRGQELRAKLEEELRAQKEREKTFEQEMQDLKALQNSWAVDSAEMESRREEQHQHREAELIRLGMHLTDIDSKDLASAPRLVNLHPDPALKGCLVYYLPLGESVIGSDEDQCRVRLNGPGISPKMCTICNADNARLSVKPVDVHCLVRINGVQVDMDGVCLADGDRVAVGQAAIFQVHIPKNVGDAGKAEGVLEFEAAVEEIAACAQVDPLWENGLRKAMQLVRTDYGEEASKNLLQQAKSAAEVIGTANDMLKQIEPPDRRDGVRVHEMSIMFDARGLPEVCVVARAEPTPWENISRDQSLDCDLPSLDSFLKAPSPKEIARRRCPPSMGIWELSRFRDEQLPLLKERMAEMFAKPWAKIEAEDEVGGVTFYTIRLKACSQETVHKKRYKDFQAFDKMLRTREKLRDSLPQLPDAGMFGLRHALGLGDFNEKRWSGLQAYLDTLMEHTDGRDLSEFLSSEGSSVT